LPARLLALAQALSVTERQLHGSPLNIRRVVSRICGALFRGSLARIASGHVDRRIQEQSARNPFKSRLAAADATADVVLADSSIEARVSLPR
ncbi:hypothetical protein ABVD91_22370, partial [Xanthomonas euvesicatoria]